VPDGVDPKVDILQAARRAQPIDLILAEPELQQLSSSNDAMLPARKRRERVLPTSRRRNTAVFAEDLRLDLHAPILAGMALQRTRGL
jgi:hypothetical protein